MYIGLNTIICNWKPIKIKESACKPRLNLQQFCIAYFVIYPVCCFIVVFDVTCLALWSHYVERCGAVVKRRTRDREVPGSIPTNCKCCFLDQETLSTLLSTGFYPGKKRATWKISTRLLNVLPSINKVDYYYYYYYYCFAFCWFVACLLYVVVSWLLLPLGVIGRLNSVIGTLSEHRLRYSLRKHAYSNI